MSWARISAFAVVAVALVSCPAGAQPSVCTLENDSAAWIRGAFDSWSETRRSDLRLSEGELPWVILFDASCVWQVNANGRTSALAGTSHHGRIVLPDESAIDAKVTSFAGTYGTDDRPFLVMALPVVWRQEPRHAANADLERLMRSVFVHEMTHTVQAHATGVWLKALEQRTPLPADLTDDIIQQKFGAVAGFQDAYEMERDLLFRAAAEPDRVRRRALASQALAAITTRRSRYLSGDNAMYGDLENLFLNMEGVANWAGYRAALREIGNPADALTLMRRARSWSQDEGLALFLVIDSLVPGWQSEVFGAVPASVIDLLQKATNPIG
jgi:hypothetical protein